MLNPDETGSNEQCLPSTQTEMIQSRQSVSKFNKDTDSMVAKQILCKTRVYIAPHFPALHNFFGFKFRPVIAFARRTLVQPNEEAGTERGEVFFQKL
jgi:hypothetical protein